MKNERDLKTDYFIASFILLVMVVIICSSIYYAFIIKRSDVPFEDVLVIFLIGFTILLIWIILFILRKLFPNSKIIKFITLKCKKILDWISEHGL